MTTSAEDRQYKMSPGFSMFNRHVNDAGKRAMRLLEEQFPTWAERVKALDEEGGGIMYLLQVPPEPASAAYVALVTAFVNEDKGEIVE